jgi:RNA polymerase sigma-32 factor
MSIDSFTQRLIDRAKRAPTLSAAEELDCIRAWQERRDRRAAGRLVLCNSRHVVFTAFKFQSYGIQVADLISEGHVGLMKALDRFDESKGVRFSTYAIYWIRAHIIASVMEGWSVLSGPRGALDSRVFFRLRRERAELWKAEGEGTGLGTHGVIERLAASFGVSERRMEEMLSQLDNRGVSLDAQQPGQEQSLLDEQRSDDDQASALENRQLRAQLERAVARARRGLDPREAFIVERRLMADPEEKLSLGEIGARFGVSRERVRQIEVRARRKLRIEACREDLDLDTNTNTDARAA